MILKKKFKITKELVKELIYILILLIIPILSFLLVKIGYIERFSHEIFLLLIFCFFFFIRIEFILIFFLVAIITVIQIFFSNNFEYIVNFSILPLSALFINNTLIRIKILNKVLQILVLYTFILTITDFISGTFVEGGDRISGPFTSSLHLSYFLVFLSLIITHSNMRANVIFSLMIMIIISSFISGSRVATVSSLIFFLFFFYKQSANYKIIIILFLSILFIGGLFNFLPTRGLSVIVEAEEIRIQGFISFYHNLFLLQPEQVIFGNSRYNYGALGYKFNDLVFGTESSAIMLIYSYGLILGSFFVFVVILRFLSLNKVNIFLRLLLIVCFIFAPFFDSPSLSIINLTLLSLAFPFKYKVKKNIKF
jgi:hypothetical protein